MLKAGIILLICISIGSLYYWRSKKQLVIELKGKEKKWMDKYSYAVRREGDLMLKRWDDSLKGLPHPTDSEFFYHRQWDTANKELYKIWYSLEDLTGEWNGWAK